MLMDWKFLTFQSKLYLRTENNGIRHSSVSSRTEFKQGGWVLTLLSLNIIMGYILAMKRE